MHSRARLRPCLAIAVQKIRIFLLVRSSWFCVSVMRGLAQRFGRSGGSALRIAFGWHGTSRRHREPPEHIKRNGTECPNVYRRHSSDMEAREPSANQGETLKLTIPHSNHPPQPPKVRSPTPKLRSPTPRGTMDCHELLA